MGSSGEDLNKGIDASVGGLVWVRRRNGSWWPGRILGPDELPVASVPTPRSGTPVKLLGREDASVDWYNLEKSKRVKAFRCGEHDDCIEKAKATASHPLKKAVKYARREDAILHALQLESARLGNDCTELCLKPDDQQHEGQHHVDESPSSLCPNEDLSGLEAYSDSALELSHSGVSFEEPNRVDTIKEEYNQWRTPNDREEDGTEGIKRMRGLHDLGMGIASPMKRKRSQVANVHESSKRKKRSRPLATVLECTTKLSIGDACEKFSSPTRSSVPEATESKVSVLESNKSKINNSFVMNSDITGVSCENAMPLTPSRHADYAVLFPKENENSSDSGIPDHGSLERLFDIPLLGEEKNFAGLSTVISGASQKTQVGAGIQSSQSSHIESVSLVNEDHNESGSISSGTADVHNICQMMEKSASEWLLKGKRNSRSKKMDIGDEADTYTAGTVSHRFLPGTSQNEYPNHYGDLGQVKQAPITEIHVEEFGGWTWNAPQRESHTRRSSAAEMPAAQRLLPCRQSRFSVNPKYESSDLSLRQCGLYDVTVEIKSSNQPPQQVPYISLMSKLQRRAIIGHPLTVEALDDGYYNELLSLSKYYSSSSELHCKQRSGGRQQPIKPRSKSRKNPVLSKKTRKLSSLAVLEEKKQPVVEKLKGGPLIACVPLKVVFSRINAALNSC